MLITGTTIIGGITKRLRDVFTTNEIKEIYKDTPNKVEYPYIFVHQINLDHKNELNNLSNRTYMFDIRCHPDRHTPNVNSWAYSLADKIVENLRNVTLPDSSETINFTSFEIKVEQGVLHVITSTQLRVKSIPIDGDEKQPKMNTIKIEGRVK